jgi:hypothetical protein
MNKKHILIRKSKLFFPKNVRVELLPIIYRLTGTLILPFYRQIVTGKNGNDGKRENESTIIIL